MAGKSDQRAQKKREKQKKKRDAASRARASRPAPAQDAPAGQTRARAPLASASGWPVVDGYLSETWHEHGPCVHGGFVRQNADGRCGAAFFAADLRAGGVSEIVSHGDVSLQAIQGGMARRSELAGHAMHVVEGDLVVKVFRTALELDGAPTDPDVREVLAFFGSLDGSSVPHVLLTGEPPPPPAKKKSLLGWLFGGPVDSR